MLLKAVRLMEKKKLETKNNKIWKKGYITVNYTFDSSQ